MASGSGWNLWVWLAGGGCEWNLWVWLVGVVVRRYIDFLILLIPTPLLSALFCSSIPTFCSFLKMFFVLVPVLFYNLCNYFFAQYKHTYGRLRASHSSHMKGCTYFIQEEAHTNERFISCDGHQLCAFMGWGVDLEVEGLHYIDASRAAYMLGPPPSRGGDLKLKGGVNVSL